MELNPKYVTKLLLTFIIQTGEDICSESGGGGGGSGGGKDEGNGGGSGAPSVAAVAVVVTVVVARMKAMVVGLALRVWRRCRVRLPAVGGDFPLESRGAKGGRRNISCSTSIKR